MPLNPDRSLLFIHIPKNAGRSVEIATGMVSEKENSAYRWRSFPNRVFHTLAKATRDAQAGRRLFGLVDVTLTSQHLTYAEIALLGLIRPQELEKLTTFCVCRNPFDRAVSSYVHMSAPYRDDYDPKSPADFETFLERWDDMPPRDHNQLTHRRAQWEYCVDQAGRNVMDMILRFETIADDFRQFSQRYLGGTVDFPWTGNKRQGKGYSGMYSARSRDLVLKRFEKDFDLFEYSRTLD